jgi:pimeloyl-ACP methyl ester carboxylesterase
MSPVLCYVHGANSSPLTFNFIKTKLTGYQSVDIAYDVNEGAENVAKRVAVATQKAADQTGAPVTVVGHSLGGVIAACAAAQTTSIARIASMGTPYGGWRIATVARWFTVSQLLDDIHPGSRLIRGVLQNTPRIPILAVVTTAGGNPFLGEPNDGVVGIASQRALPRAKYIDVQTNHFEVLLSKQVADIVSQFISE